MSVFNSGIFNNAVFNTGAGAVATNAGGGFADYGTQAERRSVKERNERDRAKAEKVIDQVALRQAEALTKMDETQRIEELNRELQLQGIEWETKYLTALNNQREAYIKSEIARRIKQMQDNNNAIIMLALSSQ